MSGRLCIDCFAETRSHRNLVLHLLHPTLANPELKRQIPLSAILRNYRRQARATIALPGSKCAEDLLAGQNQILGITLLGLDLRSRSVNSTMLRCQTNQSLGETEQACRVRTAVVVSTPGSRAAIELLDYREPLRDLLDL